MRRKNLERKDEEFLTYVLQKSEIIHIAFSAADAPYVVPLNFVFFEEKIYFHSALEGRKLECIQENPKVGFCAAVDVSIIAEESTTFFNSVIGTGSATLVKDAEEKARALDALGQRYKSNCEHPATQKMIAKTAVVRIDIESICGKEKNTFIPLKQIV